jgi:cell wall assembly regulator SMI1
MAAKKKSTSAKGKGKTATSRKASPPKTPYDAAIARVEEKARKAGVTLRPGASEAALAAAEKALGRTLPEEVRAFYRHHDGTDDYVVEGRELLSLERIADEWDIWRDLLEKGTFAANDHGAPGRGVQKRWWIWEWVPVTYDGSGNHHVLDLAPAKGGTYGQILSFWHDDEERKLVGKSFLAWLAKAKWGLFD